MENLKTDRNQGAELSLLTGTVLQKKWCGQVCLVVKDEFCPSLQLSAERIWKQAWVTHLCPVQKEGTP